jgi:protein-tyrosine phosphatase
MKNHLVLFLCTGNFYRSRFAEIYFNHRATQLELPLRAFSRGIQSAAGRNKGPISVFTINYLRELEIPIPGIDNYPVQLQESDFEQATETVALDETEHRPMILRDFPHRLDQVTFWHFPDIQFEQPTLILPAIKNEIDLYFST